MQGPVEPPTPEFLSQYFQQTAEIARRMNLETLNRMVERLVRLRRERGRLFLVGVGGSAANCSHAVSDFRKLAGLEAYTPADNVSELTARTNDEGWETVFSGWLQVSQAAGRDALLVLSVGGGDLSRNISPNLVAAIEEARKRGLTVMGIVGRDGGYTRRAGDLVLVIPTVEERNTTPHTEAFQAVVWHALVSDPRLKIRENKWESMTATQGAR